MEAFSDGVFAIAITLLVLDFAIHPPGSPLHQVLHIWPSFVAYVISFFTIGIIWVNHHAMFRLIRRSDRRLLFANLALLLFVVGSMVIGFALGGRQPADRSAMVLGTTFRNVAAALVVASGNFAGTATVPYILVGALILLVVTLPTAKILGRRQAAAAA